MIVGIYDRTLDFKSLLGSYIFQREIMRIRINSVSTFKKRFDSMIKQQSQGPELMSTTELLEVKMNQN